MASPTVNWNLVEVRAKYVDYQGEVLEGRVIFTPAATRAIDQDALTIIIGSPFAVPLVDGELSIQIPATDDPDITPINFTYGVKEDFDGGSEYAITVPLAAEGVGIDLAVVSPETPNVGTPETEITRLEYDNFVARFIILEIGQEPDPSTPDDSFVFRKV